MNGFRSTTVIFGKMNLQISFVLTIKMEHHVLIDDYVALLWSGKIYFII